MDLPLRPWTPDEDAAVSAALARTFLLDPDPAVDEVELAVLEHDRTLSAWDRGSPVASAAAFSFDLAVPGSVLPVAGVTWVGVQPTHRRQGLLTRMMTAQLTALHEGDGRGGEAVAALWASEPAIYGRFGYGAASRSLRVEVRRGDALRPSPRPAGGRVVELPVDSARPLLAEVWEGAWRARPGQYARDPRWWDQRLLDPASRRGGYAAVRCAVLEGDDGRPRGYALFAAREGDDGRAPAGQVRVDEVAGLDDDAVLALWRFVLGLDLVSTWTGKRLALDDPLVAAVTDQRRLAARLGDGLYVRLVRVGEALAARRYACEVEVVVEVEDRLLPGNARRWRLSGGPQGAVCEPTADAADLAVDVEALGAAYLGGPTLVSLAAAGRVQELAPGALVAASRALRGDVEPLCSLVF